VYVEKKERGKNERKEEMYYKEKEEGRNEERRLNRLA
jgi:hypothetical protein